MQLSVLHSFMGDKEIEFDTETPEGRQKISEVLNKLLKAGTAIFLERADKTYRVTGWDPATDKLLIQNPGRWPTGESRRLPESEVVEGQVVTPPPALPAPKVKKNGRRNVRAGTRRGRMTAVAPTAGG